GVAAEAAEAGEKPRSWQQRSLHRLDDDGCEAVRNWFDELSRGLKVVVGRDEYRAAHLTRNARRVRPGHGIVGAVRGIEPVQRVINEPPTIGGPQIAPLASIGDEGDLVGQLKGSETVAGNEFGVRGRWIRDHFGSPGCRGITTQEPSARFESCLTATP